MRKFMLMTARLLLHVKNAFEKKFIALDDAFDCIDTVYGMGYPPQATLRRGSETKSLFSYPAFYFYCLGLAMSMFGKWKSS